MPAVRLSSRRGSAVARRRSSTVAFAAKPGTYGYTPPPVSPSAPVTFAPNVTPTTFSAPSPTPSPFGSPSLTTDLPLPLFPPSATPAPGPTRKRCPPGKRRSQGYVPRPPNAFMLFRADFVRQKHVPGSIETNHGSLSKIIGNCWRALPLPEKHIWEVKAKHAKAEHKLKYPDYKFRPVHNKNRAPATSTSNSASSAAAAETQRSASATTTAQKNNFSPEEDERRCEEVAALLLQGKKGQELASAVRDLDARRRPAIAHHHSHSHSSVSPAPYDHELEQHEVNSKFPHPLNLDPMYFPHHGHHQLPSAGASSPPSSTLSHATSSAGSPYVLPMPLHQEEWRHHRRSSSVPLPNDYAYTFPPFMYPAHAPHAHSAAGLTLPPINFPGAGADNNAYTLPPPPPSSSDDSLSGLPMSISGAGRMSFSWMNAGATGTGSSFSYPRPSFSFGFGGSPSSNSALFGAGAGGRGSFSFGGAWGGPGGRRASSAQAFFSSTFAHGEAQQHQQEAEEELPDADTSLFEVGFLNSFGSSAPLSAGSPVNESVGPFAVMHAPQPVHPVSPLGFEQQHGYAAAGEEAQYADAHPMEAIEGDYSPLPLPSAPTSPYENAPAPTATFEHQQVLDAASPPHPSHDAQDYPPFEFPTEHESLPFESRLRTSIDMLTPAASAAYESYANEFV